MNLLTVTNLHPRPDQPQRGLFNLQLFRELHQLLRNGGGSVTNVCLVPSWRTWQWDEIRSWRNPHDADYETRYVPAFYMPLLGRGLSWQYYLNALEREVGNAAQYDGVFAPWLYPDGVSAVSYAHSYKLPSWPMALGSDVMHLASGMRRRAILRACDQSSRILCVCQSLKDNLIRNEVGTDKIVVVPNGVDTSRFRYDPEALSDPEATFSIPLSTEKGKTLLFVGNLVYVKGVDILLRAWQHYKQTPDQGRQMREFRDERLADLEEAYEQADVGDSAPGEDDRLVIIGEGPMLSELTRMANELDIADSVHFVGSVGYDQVAMWMNAADCLCLASRSEGMPNVVQEALACGLPVIATDAGACKEMLVDAPESQIVHPESPIAIAEAIDKALGQSCDRRRCADRYVNARTWADQARDILAIMEATC